MSVARHDEFKEVLESKKAELTKRLDRIHANLRRGYEADSKERAKQCRRRDSRHHAGS